MMYRLITFLLLNFGALAIGGFFTGKGVPSSWYVSLIKAPWTPPGWVFGMAYTNESFNNKTQHVGSLQTQKLHALYNEKNMGRFAH